MECSSVEDAGCSATGKCPERPALILSIAPKFSFKDMIFIIFILGLAIRIIFFNKSDSAEGVIAWQQ